MDATGGSEGVRRAGRRPREGEGEEQPPLSSSFPLLSSPLFSSLRRPRPDEAPANQPRLVEPNPTNPTRLGLEQGASSAAAVGVGSAHLFTQSRVVLLFGRCASALERRFGWSGMNRGGALDGAVVRVVFVCVSRSGLVWRSGGERRSPLGSSAAAAPPLDPLSLPLALDRVAAAVAVVCCAPTRFLSCVG
jgi:hypothetical protein